MTPERADLPRRPRAATAAENPFSARQRRQEVRAVGLIAVMIILVAVLHLFADARVSGIQMEQLYRRLYYIPIIYAAFVFGKRGGALAALVAALPFGIHAQLIAARPLALGFENWMEIITFVVVGVLFG